MQVCRGCVHTAVLRYPVDAYALVQKGRLDGWYPDADLYELLIAWMCTQKDLVDAAEQIVRQELPVRSRLRLPPPLLSL